MATYKYTGLTSSGVKVEGVVKASDKAAASLEIRRSVDFIETIKEVEETPDIMGNLFRKKISIKDLALVCKQFSIILHAGLPIATSIRLVGNQVKEKNLKRLLLDVCDDVVGGATVADAFEARDNTLPTTFIESIRAGEASGKLDIAFDRLSRYFTNRSKSAGKVKSALIYPIIVICVAVVVVGILMIFAVPKFTETFADLGTELPWITKALIGMSNFFVKYWWTFIVLALICYAAYKMFTKTEAGRYAVDSFRLTIPVLGKIRMMSASSEFANSFATMLAAGIPAVKALNITGRSITNFAISRDVLESCSLVESGYKIGDSLKQTSELPDLLLEVIGVGEGSGSLEHTLTVISEFYDEEVEAATRNALTILEPATILVLAVIVLFILLSVYLPMFSMYGSM